jgi:hypothetical protein
MRQMTKPAVIAAALVSALKIEHSHAFVKVKQEIGLYVIKSKNDCTQERDRDDLRTITS